MKFKEMLSGTSFSSAEERKTWANGYLQGLANTGILSSEEDKAPLTATFKEGNSYYKEYYPWVIALASISILIGLISMYVGKKEAFSTKSFGIDKKKEQK